MARSTSANTAPGVTDGSGSVTPAPLSTNVAACSGSLVVGAPKGPASPAAVLGGRA
jgi:hypothetical protein